MIEMEAPLQKNIIIVMGVSGSGKTSVGRILANSLNLPFLDADDLHPVANIDKMSQGIPLNDEDRAPWLSIIHNEILNNLTDGLVLACSALKKTYRDQLSQNIASNIQFVYLKGHYDHIYNRMKMRKDHFMDAEMLQSQFDALEEPTNAIIINIANTVENIVKEIKTQLL